MNNLSERMYISIVPIKYLGIISLVSRYYKKKIYLYKNKNICDIRRTLMFTIQYTSDDGGRAVAMAMLSLPPTKPLILP